MAARREGLSVGEWLTRRILRGLMDGETARWSANADHHGAAEDFSGRQMRDTEEMLNRVSRNETETNNVHRRIEEQLRALARRLEATERTQSENSRAVSQATTEINIAARERAQAFDQLGAHVMGLGDRLARVERGSASDGMKDAIRGLHTGLSRLTDQIAEIAGQSASQVAAVARGVETVSGKLNDARGEAETAARRLSARIATLEERLGAAEMSAQGAAEKFDRAVAAIESLRNAQSGQQSENQRQAQLITKLSDALDRLSSRIVAGEAQTAGAVARLEEQIAHVQTRQDDAAFDSRLQRIEQTLADLTERLETAERNAAGAAPAAAETPREFPARLNGADEPQRETVALLQAAPIQQAPLIQEGSPSQAAPAAADANFDLPPFPEAEVSTVGSPSAAPAAELPPFHGAGIASASPFAAQALADPVMPVQSADTADSYIAAARRSARAAAAAEAQSGLRTGLGGFTWGAAESTAPEAETPKSGSTRYLLVASIVAIAAAAVVAGILLSHGLIGKLPTQAFVQHAAVAVAHGAPAGTDALKAGLKPPMAPIAPTRIAGTTPSPPTVPLRPATLVAPLKIKPAPLASTSAAPPARAAAPPAAPPRHDLAFERLATLATAGSVKAQLLLGLKYLDGDGAPANEAEAAKWLERAAKQDEALAAYRLGTLYERGRGVPADASKAMQWYATAARLGNRKAMHNLAVAYAEGSGTQKDLTEAAQWFSKAAALGLADSEFNLAVLYERGMGVQQSLIDAYKWYAIAAAQGDTESKARLDVIATQLSPEERAAAQKAAGEFHPLPLDSNANVPPAPSAID